MKLKNKESVTKRYRRHLLYAHNNNTARSTSMMSNNNNNNMMVSDDERKNFCPKRRAQRESTPLKKNVSIMMKTLNKACIFRVLKFQKKKRERSPEDCDT